MDTSFHDHKKLSKQARDRISLSTQKFEENNEEEKYERLEINDTEEWDERIDLWNNHYNLKRK